MKRLLITVVLWYCCWEAIAQEEVKRPNIVLYVADDLGVWDIGPYGNTYVKTPYLDRLRSESVLFRQAFSTSPTCVPARSALFTAQYPHRNGSHINRMPVHNDVKSIVQYFVDEGYRVAIAGKLHVGPQEVFAFEYVKGSNRREPGTEGLQGMYTDLYLAPVDDWLAGRDTTRPFVLIVADHSTHVTWPQHPIYTTDEVDIPPFHVDTEETRRERARYYTDVAKLDTNVGDLMKMLDEHKLTQQTIFVFTADQGPQWAFGKWRLYDYGVQVPLLIRWPGHIGGGTETDALVSHVDIIPTLLDIIEGSKPEVTDGSSFAHLFTHPDGTHREFVFATHNGDKALDSSPARMVRSEKFKYIVNLDRVEPAVLNKEIVGILPSWEEKAADDKQARDVVSRLLAKPREELYDLTVDRYEMHNLAELPEYAEVLRAFRSQLAAIREDQGDIGDRWKADLKKLPAGNGPNPLVPYGFK